MGHRPVYGLQMEVVEENLFTFEFFHREDMMIVLEEGPWHFDGYLLALKPMTDDTQLRKEEIDSMQI